MERADIHTFVKAMSGANVHIDDHAQWVNVPCVLARWTHEGGTDNSPSFGISIDPLSSKYHCFTCGSKGTLTGLVDKLERLSGKHYPVLEEYVEAEEIGGIVPEWVEGDEAVVESPSLPEDTIYMYDLAGDHPYLKDRGVNAEVANALGLRVDLPEDTPDNRERILFPVYSTLSGELTLSGFTGRAIDDEKVLKVKDYYGLKKSDALLGVERITDEHKFILVVEGLFAYARVSSYRLPVVAIMGSNMSKHQAQMLIDLGKSVYIFTDNDRAGFKARYQILNTLDGYVPVYTMMYPEGTDGLDPDDITSDEVKEMINKARLV